MKFLVCWLLLTGVVFTVEARDDDAPGSPFSTITYSIIGDEGVPGVFAINPQTGEIQLISSLVTANQNVFQVGTSTQMVCGFSLLCF